MPVHHCCLQCNFFAVDTLRARCMRSRTARAVESLLRRFKGMSTKESRPVSWKDTPTKSAKRPTNTGRAFLNMVFCSSVLRGLARQLRFSDTAWPAQCGSPQLKKYRQGRQ